MKPPRKKKRIIVSYKGWHCYQTPWRSFDGIQYSKVIFNPEGKMMSHAGYGNCLTSKQLRLMLMGMIDFFESGALEKLFASNSDDNDDI